MKLKNKEKIQMKQMKKKKMMNNNKMIKMIYKILIKMMN